MVTAPHLMDDPVAACAGYHAIGNCVIRRGAVMAVTAADRAGLTWSGVHAVVVGHMFGGVGCHAASKGEELSCDIDYAISFWSWILSWTYPRSMDIIRISFIHPYFVEIIHISWKCPRSVDIIRILCIYPYLVDIIRILW